MKILLGKIITRLLQILFYFKNFIIPNLFVLKSIKYKWKKPVINQLLLLRGEGSVNAGQNCVFGYKFGGRYRSGCIELQPRYHGARIIFGNNISSNNNLFICAANLVIIGDDTLIGQNVSIFDHEAHGVASNKRREIGKIGEVHIGRNVWIGNNVTILKNSTIGNNSVIAAGAVVSGHFPNDVIIGGVPARIIKRLNENK